MALGKSVALLAIGFLLSKYLLGWVFEKISKTPEMVAAMSLASCGFMGGVGDAIGLSMEMGALIAGVAVSSFPYCIHVTAKVLPLRDFFLTLCFLSIGTKIPVPDTPMLTGALAIVLFRVSLLAKILIGISLSTSGLSCEGQEQPTSHSYQS